LYKQQTICMRSVFISVWILMIYRDTQNVMQKTNQEVFLFRLHWKESRWLF